MSEKYEIENRIYAKSTKRTFMDANKNAKAPTLNGTKDVFTVTALYQIAYNLAYIADELHEMNARTAEGFEADT